MCCGSSCCSIAFLRQLCYAVLLYSEDLFGSVLLVDRFYWIEVYYKGAIKIVLNCAKCSVKLYQLVLIYWHMMKGHSKLKYLSLVNKSTVKVDTSYIQSYISWDDDPPLIRCSIEKQLPTLEIIDKRQTCWLIGKIIAKVLDSRFTLFHYQTLQVHQRMPLKKVILC